MVKLQMVSDHVLAKMKEDDKNYKWSQISELHNCKIIPVQS